MHSIDLRLKVTRKLISNNDSRLDSGSTNVYSFISVTVLLFNYLFLFDPENPAISFVPGAGSIFLSPDRGHGNQLR